MAEHSINKSLKEKIFGYLIYKHLSREGNLEVKTDTIGDNWTGTGHLYAIIDDDFYFNVEINQRDLVICSGFKDIAFDDYVMSLEDISQYAYSITELDMAVYCTRTSGYHNESAIMAEVTRNFIISFNKYKHLKDKGR